jgi:hypothetical protein
MVDSVEVLAVFRTACGTSVRIRKTLATVVGQCRYHFNTKDNTRCAFFGGHGQVMSFMFTLALQCLSPCLLVMSDSSHSFEAHSSVLSRTRGTLFQRPGKQGVESTVDRHAAPRPCCGG